MFLFLKYLSVALLIIFALSLATEGEVKGRILSPQKLPLKNKSVSLASDSLVIRMTRTDEQGYFKFSKLPKGNYRLLIMIDGFEKYTSGFFTLTPAKPSKDLGAIELEPLN